VTNKNLRIDNLDPNLLQANPWNTNVFSPDAERKLTESLKRFGFFKPVLVRELPNGSLEVIGGEHRWQASLSLKYATVPVVNLGRIDDKTAKEISLVDNGRYGNDDALGLAELLGELGDVAELASFMPFETADMERLFSSVQVALDDLELGDEDEKPVTPTQLKPRQEFQIMRFKVPIDDAAKVQDAIDKIMKQQKFTEDDSLTNAGHALVHLINNL
jgi:ParB-like chromosome segregation protein Spo0J